MSNQAITLVGRASDLSFKEFESGATLVCFKLTVKGRNQGPEIVFQCEGVGKEIAEQFEVMNEGCLVGVIGKLGSCRAGAHVLIEIDSLEVLGKPLATVEA